MKTVIPETLIIELAERRCVLFVGSGCSRQCLSEDGKSSPPSWGEFLSAAVRIAHPDDQETARSLIKANRFLDAAEVIESRRDPATFTQFICDVFEKPKFIPSRLHDDLIRIDPKIYLTTNYDDIIERSMRRAGIEDFRMRVCTDENVVDVIRSPKRLLYKVHGCLSKPDSIVLSRSDYFSLKQRYGFSYRVLDALFLCSTVLFIGCGLDDPDIQLVLENAQVSALSTHPHYAIMPSGMAPAIMSSIKRSYNIEVLPYDNSGGTHSNLMSVISEIADRVEAVRA